MAGANIKIGANSSEFQNQMREVNRQLKLVSSECGVAAEKAKLFGNAQEKLSSIQNELTAKIQAQNKVIDLYKDRITNINRDIDKQKMKQSELTSKIDETSKKYKESIEATGKDSEASKKLKNELQGLKEEYAKNEKAIENSNNKLTDATTKMNTTEKTILKNKKALEDVNKEIANAKLDKISESFGKASSVSGELSDKLKPVSTAIIGLGGASATASITFEDSMAKVMTIADQSTMSYDDMKKAIMTLSNQTGISANEIADNVYDAISAGQSTADAVNFVSQSTKLAKAGFAEAGQSLDLLTTIMNSYELESSEVNKVSDILIQTQNKGKVTVGELSADMGKLIPTAKSNGVALEQVATGYALMTSKGIKSAESTTYMNSMMNELGKSGTKVSDNIKELTGKSFQELISSGSTVGDILSILDENAKANGKSLADMFGSSEAAKAAMILVTDSGKAFNESLKEMGNSAGAADTAFKVVDDTTGNKLKKSFNEVKNSAINMGDTLAPVTSEVASGFSKITSVLSKLDSTQLKTIAGIGGSVISINVALGAFSKLTGGISKTVNAYKDFKKYSGKAIDSLKSFNGKAIEGVKSAGNFASSVGKGMVNATTNGAKAVGKLAVNLGKATIEFAKSAVQAGISTSKIIAHKVATIASTVATNTMRIAQAALNLVMSLNPITLIIIAIGALVTTIVLLYKKCEWFRDGVKAIGEALKIGWKATVDFFKNLWHATIVFFTNKINEWKATFDNVINIIKNIWENVCNIFKKVWSGVCEYFKELWGSWKNIFSNIVDFMKSVWQGICDVISSIWNGIVNSIMLVWDGWKNIFKSVADGIRGIWDGLCNTVGSVWDKVVEGVKTAWQGITSPFKKVVDAIGNMWQGIKSLFKLPHFTLSGTLNPLKWSDEGLPKIGVDWYWKGGIFNSPTVLNSIGVGDAFNGQGSKSEAIVPLDEMYRNIETIVNSAQDKGKCITQNFYIYGDNENGIKTSKAVKKAMRDLALGM